MSLRAQNGSLTRQQEFGVKDCLEHLVTQMVEHGISHEIAVLAFKRQFTKLTSDKNRGNLSRSAQALGVHRNTLTRKIEEWGLGGSL